MPVPQPKKGRSNMKGANSMAANRIARPSGTTKVTETATRKGTVNSPKS